MQFFAAIAVGKLKRAEAVGALAKMLAASDNKDPYLRHAGVMGLAGSATQAGSKCSAASACTCTIRRG